MAATALEVAAAEVPAAPVAAAPVTATEIAASAVEVTREVAAVTGVARALTGVVTRAISGVVAGVGERRRCREQLAHEQSPQERPAAPAAEEPAGVRPVVR